MRLTTDRHTAEGTLRRLVDDPAGVADADREHVAGCAACRSTFAAVREDAAAVGAALEPAPVPDLDAAWERLAHAIAVEAPPRTARPARRRRPVLRRPALAGIGAAAVLAGASVAAAADWLPIFRTEAIAPLAVEQSDLVALPDLSDYGTVRFVREIEFREAPDAAAAAARTGLAAPVVRELPRGVTGEPEFQVTRQAVAEFTFSAEEAARTAREDGEAPPAPPPGLDGSRFRFAAGPGLAALWSEARGIPAMVVARAVAPTAVSSGVPFATARDYLLSVPGLPRDVAAQLRRFDSTGTTLPLVVPTPELSTSTADVGGRPATVLSSRDGTISAVLWIEDGMITAVAGTLSGDEVLAVARGLEWRR